MDRRAARIARRDEIENMLQATFSRVQDSQKEYLAIQKEYHEVSEGIRVDEQTIRLMTETVGSPVDILNLANITKHLSSSALSNILALSSGGRDLLEEHEEPLAYDPHSFISHDDTLRTV